MEVLCKAHTTVIQGLYINNLAPPPMSNLAAQDQLWATKMGKASLNRVFQIALSGRGSPHSWGTGNFVGGFTRGRDFHEEWFCIQPFSNTKDNVHEVTGHRLIKISMAHGYVKHEIEKKEKDTAAMTLAKNKVFWVIKWKLLFSGDD